MAVVVTHAKTDNIANWTQADLNVQIALGNYPIGTLLADIVLPSDWNANHTISGLGSIATASATDYIKTDGTSIVDTIPFQAGTNVNYSIVTDGTSTGGFLNAISFRNGGVEWGNFGMSFGFGGFLIPAGMFMGTSLGNFILVAGTTFQISNAGGTDCGVIRPAGGAYFPVNQGDFYGSVSTPNASITSDATDLILNSRVTGTGATSITYNLNVALAQAVYSQFGATANIFSTQADLTDRLVSNISSTRTSGFVRGFVGVSEFTGTSGASSGNFDGITGYGGTASTSTQNLTATNNGGGAVGVRGIGLNGGSGTIAQLAGVSGNITAAASTTTTDAFGFIAEGGTIGGAATLTRIGGLWIKDPGKGVLGYGLRIDDISASTGNLQVALAGNGAGSGIYLETTLAAGGRSYLRASTANNINLSGTTGLTLEINSTAVLTLISSSITAAQTFKFRTGGTAAGSGPAQFTSAALLTAPVAGVEEFLTDKRYVTITTGTARKEYTLNNAALTSGIVPVATTNGRLTDGGATTTELSYLSGVTSAIQTQLDSKPKTLFVHFADANNSGTGETDLYSDTLVAGQLATNGDKLEIQYSGVFSGAVSSTQQLKCYFGGTAIFDSGALSIGVATPAWDIYITVVRVSSSVVRCVAQVTTSSAALSATSQYTEVTGLTLGNTQIAKITGTAAGVGGGSNQITAKFGTINYAP